MKWVRENWQLLLLALSAIGFAFAPIAIIRLANATEYGNLVTSEGVVCNTAEQIERYLSIEGDTESSLAVVNAENGESVCTSEHVQFVVGGLVKIVPAKHGSWHVTEIGVIAIRTNRGFKYLLKPEVLYSAFMVQQESIASALIELVVWTPEFRTLPRFSNGTKSKS
jgi:hypothetical protein